MDKFIVFASNRTGSFNIWRMNVEDGSDLKQLTFSDSNFYPAVSPIINGLLLIIKQITKLSIWRVPLQGGDATKLSRDTGCRHFHPMLNLSLLATTSIQAPKMPRSFPPRVVNRSNKPRSHSRVATSSMAVAHTLNLCEKGRWPLGDLELRSWYGSNKSS